MPFFEKLRKMWQNIEILNLSQQKEEEIIELFSIRTKFHTTKVFTKTLLVTEMKKTEILMNKPSV